MEKLNQTLFEVYKTSPYQIFANKTTIYYFIKL